MAMQKLQLIPFHGLRFRTGERVEHKH
jgi:hypothetical protein